MYALYVHNAYKANTLILLFQSTDHSDVIRISQVESKVNLYFNFIEY
jgi:hypothetical protein